MDNLRDFIGLAIMVADLLIKHWPTLRRIRIRWPVYLKRK